MKSLSDLKETMTKECEESRRKAEVTAQSAVAHREIKETPSAPHPNFSFPSTVSRYLVGMARTEKMDFVQHLDLGVPVDDPFQSNPRVAAKERDVLLLYQKASALPTSYNSSGDQSNQHSDDDDSVPMFSTKEALENCDFVNVILTDHSAGRNQCWAMVPQYESYSIQRWMRIKPGQTMNSNDPLRLVGRGTKSNGHNDFDPPARKDIDKGIDILQNYLKNLDSSLEELKPLVEKVATRKNTVTVMVVNFGQSELLVNHVCASKSRGLDTSSILVFATDVESKELATELGLTVFYDEPVSTKPLDPDSLLWFLICSVDQNYRQFGTSACSTICCF